MNIIATYNIKGGVGKTATAVNLAWLAARDGYRTLLWDLDPQGAATYYYRIKPKIKGGGKALLDKKHPLSDLIKGSDFPLLDLLPADFAHRHLDILLEGKKDPTRRLHKRLHELAPDYDLVLIDCPPSISLVSEAVFYAANILLVPVIPSTLSLRTLEQLLAFRAEKHLDELFILPFFSMADRRKKMHRDIISNLKLHHPQLLETIIPTQSDVEKMGLHAAPIGTFAPSSAGARAFAQLWHELQSVALKTA